MVSIVSIFDAKIGNPYCQIMVVRLQPVKGMDAISKFAARKSTSHVFHLKWFRRFDHLYCGGCGHFGYCRQR